MQNSLKIDTPEILKLLFHPPATKSGKSCPENTKAVALTVSPGVSIDCRFYDFAADAPTILYFHGGGESPEELEGEAKSFIRHGINIFIVSYRGYGNGNGSPSVSSMFVDSRKLFILATEKLKNEGFSGPLFIMGRSLGSVCAIDIVQSNNDSVKGLVIESGFCETAPLLQAIGVPVPSANLAEDEGFDNITKIAQIKLPTLFFHGAKDTRVPVAQAERLQSFSGARNKQFFIIPGADHHSISKIGGDLYFQKIKEFINTVCGVNTWRQRRRELKRGRTGESV